MDVDIGEVLGVDCYLRDPPKTEDLSQLATSTISNAVDRLSTNPSRDDAFLKSILLDLMLAEKRCRLAYDSDSSAQICKFILETLYNIGDLKNVNYYLAVLNKKRGQLKAAIVAMVDLAKSWIPLVVDMDQKLQLIETLNQITTGKMFLETQRAEIMFGLAKLKEDAGQISEAAKVLYGVEVETFGSLPKREKVQYILEQMRIQLLDADYIRFYMTSKKVNEKLLECDDYAGIKLQFLEYMIKYYLHEGDFFSIAKASYQRSLIFWKQVENNNQEDTDGKDALQAQWKLEFETCVLFSLLSPTTSECIDFLKFLSTNHAKQLKRMELLGSFFNEFLLDNLLPLPLDVNLETFIKEHVTFAERPWPGGASRLEMLWNRIVQHNIKVIGKFYSTIRLERMAQLASASVDVVELEISNMVQLGSLDAKIDRVSSVVSLRRPRDPETVLNEWSHSIAGLINLVDQSCRLVQKEKMITEAREKQLELEALQLH